MFKNLYHRLAVFFWQKAISKGDSGGTKIGLPHFRDKDAICEYYAPRKPLLEDFTGCEGDGHYLCKKCCHFKCKN